MSTGSMSPLLCGDQSKKKRISFTHNPLVLVLAASSFALLLAFIAYSQGSLEKMQRSTSLIQEKAPLYYKPQNNIYRPNAMLPAHIDIPENGAKVDYTLVESPTDQEKLHELPLYYKPQNNIYRPNGMLPAHIDIPENGAKVDYTLVESPTDKGMLDELPLYYKPRPSSILPAHIVVPENGAKVDYTLVESPTDQDMLHELPLYYKPQNNIYRSNSMLPVHIEIPENGAKVDYTLVESPTDQYMLDELENGTDANATNASSTPLVFKCNLNGVTVDGDEMAQIDIKAEAAKVFTMWDRCARAADYVAPNKGTLPGNARRLLTQSIVTPTTWDYPTAPNATEVCGGPAFPCPTLSECEDRAAKVLCHHLSKCTNPVCGTFYVDPEIERICGVCTMASGAVTRSCWSSVYSLWHCMFH